MLRSTTDTSRLYLTADLRALESKPSQTRQERLDSTLHADLTRFPPVEDVIAVLDRIASRAFAA